MITPNYPKSKQQYRIKDGSAYFFNKYGTRKPIVFVEGTDENVIHKKWNDHKAIVSSIFMDRMNEESKMSKALTEPVYCCKIELDGTYLSEFILESEIEAL